MKRKRGGLGGLTVWMTPEQHGTAPLLVRHDLQYVRQSGKVSVKLKPAMWFVYVQADIRVPCYVTSISRRSLKKIFTLKRREGGRFECQALITRGGKQTKT